MCLSFKKPIRRSITRLSGPQHLAYQVRLLKLLYIFEAAHKCTHVRFYRRWICFVYLIKKNNKSFLTFSQLHNYSRQQDGSYSDKFEIGTMIGHNYFEVLLPSDLTCDHCVFQFRYKTGKE